MDVKTPTLDGVQDLTVTQRERRQRIVDATIGLASRGGFDGVQMRDVADRADVALGTLYRYFPSKVHLLVSVMVQQTEHLNERLRRHPPVGETPAERVFDVLVRMLRALQRDPSLTEAMTRALMFADASTATEVDAISAAMTDAITRAIHGNDHAPSEDELARAHVIEQVCWSSILAWLSGRSSAKQMADELETAARLLFA